MNENNLNVEPKNLSQMSDKELIDEAIKKLVKKQVNLLIVGETGVGKSSTIKALFDIDAVEIGIGMQPQTMETSKYQKDNLTIWDSPGLGEERDEAHKDKILELLYQKDSDGKMFIDLVLVLLDFSHRDFGTAYKFINEVIPLELKSEGRVIIAVNKCDLVRTKGNGVWNEAENKPDEAMEAYLDEQIQVVKERIEEGGNFKLGDSILYYSAGEHNEAGEFIRRPYNLTKLFYYIIERAPVQKRVALVSRRNQEQANASSNDSKDYEAKIEKSWLESVFEFLEKAGVAAKWAWDNRETIEKAAKQAYKLFSKIFK